MKLYKNRNLREKFLFAMTLLSVTVIVCVSVFFSFFHIKTLEEHHTVQWNTTLDNASKGLSQTINTVNRNVVYALSQEYFKSIYSAIQWGNGHSAIVSHYSALEDTFHTFIHNTNVVSGVTLLGKNGEYYSNFGISSYQPLSSFADFERLSQGAPVQWHPVQDHPFYKTSHQVIPITYQISHSPYMFSNMDTLVVLIVYLDAYEINTLLEQSNKVEHSVLYLADATGRPLTLDYPQEITSLASKKQVRQVVSQNSRTPDSVALEDTPYGLVSTSMELHDLRLAMIFSSKLIKDSIYNNLKAGFLGTLLALLLSFFFSSIVSASITRPIKKLMLQVDNVKRGNYQLFPVTRNNDEIKTLEQSLIGMAQTISGQIVQIKKKESLQRKAEVAILTEQINPHFLYNTLDVIRWEVLAGHQHNAGLMIEALADFLRLSLNEKEELQTIEKALLHIEKYVLIMNQRLDRKIILHCLVDEPSQALAIPKLILQPLVENSIVHGFSSMQSYPQQVSPTITLQVFYKDHGYHLLVSDNGKGFNPRTLKENMIQEGTSNVGLPNAYQRLCYYFEDVEVTFSSQPFSENTVHIIIPKQELPPALLSQAPFAPSSKDTTSEKPVE